jgi:hypothetical protein
MNKIRITLVKIGHIDHLINFKKIKNWKSKLFEIVEIQCIENLPDSDIDDGYLDQKFAKESLGKFIDCPIDSNLVIAITSCRFIDNFYTHRIGYQKIGISLYGVKEILNNANIPIDNFIINQLYYICTLYSIVDITKNDEINEIVHRDMRGCLFDFCGDRTDILYNTEKPIICDDCKGKIKRKQIAQDLLPILEKELKKIRKPFFLKVELNIKKYPLVYMLLSAIIAIGINVFFGLIWKLIKLCIEI